MEKALEILRAQDETLEEILRVAKTNELLARGLVALAEKVKLGVSWSEDILTKENADRGKGVYDGKA